MVLNRSEIAKLICEKSLISGYIDLDTQLNPNGFDLTVGCLFTFDSRGTLDFSNRERKIPEGKRIIPKKEKTGDKFGWWKLKKGSYKVRTNETVKLPLDLIALAFARSSLLRMGAFTQNAVWDAGFNGRGEFILVVENPKGLRLKENARVSQLVFARINPAEKGYSGIYQNK